MVSRAIRLCGTEQVDPPLRRLRAGPLTVDFDNGAVRYVRLNGVEVLRGIAFLVRDENWGTFSPKIEDLTIDEGSDGFTVTYRATCADAARSLVYDARITGGSDGSLSFVADATPGTDVLTNRTGFVVLHPIRDLAGRPVRVVHDDGSERTSVFPANIDPRVPFTKVRALSHEVVPGVWATCSMEGEDAYEMEDQRNWSDASYKTYVRSLKQPWPYTLAKGQAFRQAVRLEISGASPAAATASGGQDAVTLTLGGEVATMPRIGIGLPASEAAHVLSDPGAMVRLAPQFLVCQVDLREHHGLPELEACGRIAAETGAGIVLEIITRGTLDPAAELAPVAQAVRALGLALEAVTVFPAQDMVSVQPDQPWPEMPSFAETYAAARQAFPGVTLGGGMAAYFTELNRKRPPAEALDYLTFTTCPSVHAADDISVMETLEAIPHQIRSTRAFAGGRPLRIGPSQLGCRENPYGKATTPNTDNRRACLSRLDPRQRGLFNAGWTLGYAAAAAREDIAALALGAPSGPFGLTWRKAEFVQPFYDDGGAGSIFPAFHVMAGLTRLAGGRVLDVAIEGEGVAALAVRKDGRSVLWIANLTAETQTVRIAGTARPERAAVLSADAFEGAAADPDFMETHSGVGGGDSIALDAWAVARLEFAG